VGFPDPGQNLDTRLKCFLKIQEIAIESSLELNITDTISYV
jgi:hypothetical protein